MLIKQVAINGHSTLMLFSAAPLFTELEAFEASTIKAASVSSAPKILRMACIAASSTLLTSAHLHGPTSIDHILFCNSSDTFAIILVITSPTPIGQTLQLPLSNRIRKLAKIGSMFSGSSVSIRCSLGVVRMRLLWLSIISFLFLKQP